VDTPGFNDPKLSDSAILSQLAQILSLQHQFTDYKINLKGIVYLHRITDNRYDAAAERTFDIMQKICGQRALKNVALVTTMWDTGISKEVARSRERELHTSQWSAILDSGASMYTFKGKGDLAGPRAIVSQLVGGKPVVLELQEELQHDSSLLQTTAGAYTRETLENLQQQSTADSQQDRIDAERVKEEFEAGMSTLERRIGSETQETIEQAKKKDRGNLLITFLHVLQSIAQYGNLVLNILEVQGIL
jgi:Skp family chaperone for outer membrane proteins